MERQRVLVTGTGGRSVGAGILYALTRSHHSEECRQRWEVVAADADPFSFGLYQGTAAVVVPKAHHPSYLPTLQRLVKERNIAAILPGTEAEVSVLSRSAEAVAPARVIVNRPELIPLMLEKRLLAQRLVELGIDTPRTCPLADWHSLPMEYPVIVKPAVGTGGSRGVHIVTHPAAMKQLVDTLGPSMDRYLVQEYVGSGESEFTVGVLTDREGQLIDSIVLQRKLTGLSLLEDVVHNEKHYSISTGYSQGFIVENRRVQGFCEDLALRLGSRGPLNIQLRVDGRRIVVFEIHPRFSGSTPIRADAGFNEPDVLLRNHLHGESFSRLHHQTRLVAIRAFEHTMVTFDQYTALGGSLPPAEE